MDDIERQAAVVAQHQQQGPHGSVHHLHVYLEAGDELKHNTAILDSFKTHTIYTYIGVPHFFVTCSYTE